MSPLTKCMTLCLCALSLTGFTFEKKTASVTPAASSSLQPKDERFAQDALPIAKGKIWDILAKTAVSLNEEKGEYSATFPEAVKKLNGQTLRISGFILPLESSEKFTHFLLSKRTPTCPFCPPGTPTEIVEVYTTKPIEWVDDLVSIEGKFGFIDNKEMGVFFKLSDAQMKKNP